MLLHMALFHSFFTVEKYSMVYLYYIFFIHLSMGFLKDVFIYFIVWLHWAFVAAGNSLSLVRRVGATLCWGAWASHCGGFSCWGARALNVQAQGLSCFAAWHMESSCTRDRT